MKKGIKIALIIITSLMVIGGTSVFLVYFLVFNPALFISCNGTQFTSYPVEMERLKAITPLGNLGPPGHTYPTDHMYFFTNATQYPDGFEVYSPGDIITTKISKLEYDPPQLAGIVEDYTIDFVLCSKVSGRFGHINNISSFLSNITGEFGSEFGDTESSYEIDGRIYTKYTKRIRINVPSGQLLGRAGMAGGGYDFWLKDSRVKHFWVNKDISREFQHTVCPLNYYNSSMKSVMEDKITTWDGQPVYPAGYCGRIAFDVAGTAQGIWTQPGVSKGREQEYGLALVYDNFNASKGVISIGNAGHSSWDKKAYRFNTLQTGFMNRNFSHITNDGNIYYYYCEGFDYLGPYTQVILLKMDGNEAVYIQFIDNGITALPADPSGLFNEAEAVRYVR